MEGVIIVKIEGADLCSNLYHPVYLSAYLPA